MKSAIVKQTPSSCLRNTEMHDVTTWFLNHYNCPICGTIWTDLWDCACDDRCPKCNTETEPYDSVEIGPTS